MKLVALFVVSVFVVMFIQGCAVQKELVPMGGSRADGVVRLAYEYGAFEIPHVDGQQGVYAARQRCAAWGYTDAEPFGGYTRKCVAASMGSCDRWLVTVEYQCTGTGTPTASQKPPETRRTESPLPYLQQEQMIRTERSRQWTKYAKDVKGNFFYYDVTSISLTEGQYATVREWVEFSPEAAGTNNLSHVYRTTTINCRDNHVRYSNFLILDNKGQIRKGQPDPTEWKDMPAGSAIFLLANKICNK